MKKWVLFFIILVSNAAFAQKQVAYLSTDKQTEDITSFIKPLHQEIDFQLVNGMILVKASINYQSGFFILDTGAPMLVLNQINRPGALAQSTAAGCSSVFNVGESTVRHFSWAGIEKYEFKVLVTDLSHLEAAVGCKILGLIGYNLFRNHEIFIDYERQRLILFPSDQNLLHRALSPIYTSDISMHDHLPVIEFSIDGRVLRFGLDTGAETNLIDRCVVASLDKDLIDTLDKRKIQGLDKEVRTVPVIRIRKSSWNNAPMHQLNYMVIDLCHLNSADAPSINGILGFPFLRSLKLSINYRKGKIYLWEQPSNL